MQPIPLTRPTAGTVALDPDDSPWQPTDTPGFWLRPILEDGDGGTTALMKVDAGAFADTHSHDQLEEVFVVSGEFHDQYRTYSPGHYCVRAIGEQHVAGSVDGCVVLLVYRP